MSWKPATARVYVYVCVCTYFTLLILIISVVQKKSGNEHSTLFTKKFSFQTNGCFYDVYNHVPYLHAHTKWLRYFLSCSIIHIIPKSLDEFLYTENLKGSTLKHFGSYSLRRIYFRESEIL